MPLGCDVRDREPVADEAEAGRVRKVFEPFTGGRSGVAVVRRFRGEGVAAKSGWPLDQGDIR